MRTLWNLSVLFQSTSLREGRLAFQLHMFMDINFNPRPCMRDDAKFGERSCNNYSISINSTPLGRFSVLTETSQSVKARAGFPDRFFTETLSKRRCDGAQPRTVWCLKTNSFLVTIFPRAAEWSCSKRLINASQKSSKSSSENPVTFFARFAEKHGKVRIVLDVCCKFYEQPNKEEPDRNTCTPMV